MSEQARTLLKRLLAAHGSHYDILRDYRFEGKQFPGYAEFHSYGEQYVLTKRAKLWEVNTHEYLFIDIMEALDEDALQEACDFMIEKAIVKVPAGPNHMSSALSLIIIADAVSDEAAKRVRKVKFRKNYRFGVHGWADLRLAVVDLSRPAGKQVFTNVAGKPLGQTLNQNLELMQPI